MSSDPPVRKPLFTFYTLKVPALVVASSNDRAVEIVNLRLIAHGRTERVEVADLEPHQALHEHVVLL